MTIECDSTTFARDLACQQSKVFVFDIWENLLAVLFASGAGRAVPWNLQLCNYGWVAGV